MRDTPRQDDRLIELTLMHLDASLDAGGTAELRGLLGAGDAAMARFVDLCVQARAMAESLATDTVTPEPVVVGRIAPVAARRVPRWAYAAAVALIAGAAVVLTLIAMRSTPGNEPATHRSGRPVAVVTGGTATPAGAGTIQTGDDVRPGVISVDAGALELDFHGGASITVDGPAELIALAADRCELRRGRMSVRIEGGGFAVDLPDAIRVTDLGTEFEVEVAADGRSTVRVTEGAVRVDRFGREGDEAFELRAGDRCVVNADRFGESLSIMTPRLLRPVSIDLTRGDSFTGFSPMNLIADTGFVTPPTIGDYATVRLQETEGTRWVTGSQARPSYFAAGLPHPRLVLKLDRSHTLTHLVVWGYGGNTNEASDFLVEFSNDGGVTWSESTETVATTKPLASESAALAFTQPRDADAVRVTLTNNAHGRGFPGAGGDRVGLGAIRLIALDAAAPTPIRSPVNQTAPTSESATEHTPLSPPPPRFGEAP